MHTTTRHQAAASCLRNHQKTISVAIPIAEVAIHRRSHAVASEYCMQSPHARFQSRGTTRVRTRCQLRRHLWTTPLVCRKCRPREMSSATDLPCLPHAYTPSSLSVRACRRSPPCTPHIVAHHAPSTLTGYVPSGLDLVSTEHVYIAPMFAVNGGASLCCLTSADGVYHVCKGLAA